MPTYAFECEGCGPFDEWRDHARSAEPAACPSCGALAARSWPAPFVRSPSSPLASASRDARTRFERSRTGEPAVTEGLPQGRELNRHGHSHGPTRPWQIGHA